MSSNRGAGALSQRHRGAIFLITALSLLLSSALQAMEDPPVQELTGRLEAKESAFFVLRHLQAGQVLYLYAEGTSGNLDPALALLKPGMDFSRVRRIKESESVKAIAEGLDPLAVRNDAVTEFALAWNDDTIDGYAAALTFDIPADGDYRLVVGSALARPTSGSYRLVVGIDAPLVLTGEAKPTGATIAYPVEEDYHRNAVQTFEGTLSQTADKTLLYLQPFDPGDTLSVRASATSGDLKPRITLLDFGKKPLATGNFSGQDRQAMQEYTFARDCKNCLLEIAGRAPDGTITTGDYRLLLGLNQPQVLQGDGETQERGRAILRTPTPVRIGLKMQQVTDINQRQENFGVVAGLWMEWKQPGLAFRADAIHRYYKVFTGKSFSRYMSEQGLVWPDFTLFNQQGPRWTQNQVVMVQTDGSVFYFERFTATLQAPNFDFRKFPFDTQEFFIRVTSIYPVTYFTYEVKEGFSEVGGKLGEEEWMVTRFSTEVSTTTSIHNAPTSNFMFRFWAKRHQIYYIFRIFLPIWVIITVSWVIFFLKDYAKRVDAAGANLLLFIAFNFVISNQLPLLGYLTFLDLVLISTFLITALILILAVILRRMSVDGKDALASRIDKYVIGLYPVAYIGAMLIVIWFFL